MNILVIGHNSFIAQHLKQHPLAFDWTYISHKDYQNSPMWDNQIDVVLNLALDPKVKKGEFSDLDLKIGLKSQNVGAHYIALSTRAVYGVSEEIITFAEHDEFLERCTAYGRAKRAIENSLIDNLDGKKLTILRPSNIFGYEYQSGTPRKSFFGQMLYDLKHHNNIQLNMAPQTQRDFISIESFINILVAISLKPKSRIFNIGSGIGSVCENIAHDVLRGYGRGEVYFIGKPQLNDNFILNNQKLLSNYPLVVSSLSKDAIQQACLNIGKQLQKEN